MQSVTWSSSDHRLRGDPLSGARGRGAKKFESYGMAFVMMLMALLYSPSTRGHSSIMTTTAALALLVRLACMLDLVAKAFCTFLVLRIVLLYIYLPSTFTSPFEEHSETSVDTIQSISQHAAWFLRVSECALFFSHHSYI